MPQPRMLADLHAGGKEAEDAVMHKSSSWGICSALSLSRILSCPTDTLHNAFGKWGDEVPQSSHETILKLPSVCSSPYGGLK